MEFSESAVEGIVTIRVQGRLDSNSSDRFSDKLAVCMDARPKALIIDCGNLEYISSAGLRSMLMTAKRCKTESITLAIHSLQKSVLEIFEMSGLMKVFPIFPDAPAAQTLVADAHINA